MSFSFKSWPFPSPKKNNHILKCSKYGLIAHAMNNNVSILVEEFGHFTPLLMWSPFQHKISAMEWYDASNTMNTAVPVLVISSISGRLEVYDCRSRVSIFKVHINLNQANNAISNLVYPTPTALTHISANSRRENDYVTSIAWSQFSSSTFFVGTKNGRLIRFEITIGQIVKCKVEWELFFDFQIDHICIEPQFGEICAIASENGSIATIQNINKYENGKPPVASPNVVTLTNKTDSIHQIGFYTTSVDFLILVTTSNALLYSINDCCTAPLLMLPGIRRFHILHDTGNLSLIVREDSVEIWNHNKRVSSLNLVTTPKYSNQREVLVSDMMGDKLILLTSELWLTTVEAKSSSKLFVTHRVKLLDSKPLSFSYANESITFATAKGNVLISETSNSNFIAQMALNTQSQPPKMTQNESSEQQQNEISSNEKDKSPPFLLSPKTRISSEKVEQSTENSEGSEKLKEDIEKVPSVFPSPLLGNDSNNDNDENLALNGDTNDSEDDKSLNLTMRRKLSASRSQDIRIYIDNAKKSRGPKSQKTPTRKRSRVRNSIIKSCASSSSFIPDLLDESSPNAREEEILDKSIVYDMRHRQNRQLDANAPIVPSSPSFDETIPLTLPKIAQSTSRQRRFSSNPSQGQVSNSILSQVVSEGIKTMPKDSSSAIPIPRPQMSKPNQSIPSILKQNQMNMRKVSEQILSASQNSSSLKLGKNISQSISTSDVSSNSSLLSPPAVNDDDDETADEGPQKNIPLGKSSSSKVMSSSNKVLLKDDSNANGINNNNSSSNNSSNYSQISSRVIPKNKFGNNCSIMWNYQVAQNSRIENIEWIASTRVIAYTLAKPVPRKEDEKEKPMRRHSNSKLSDSCDSFDSMNRLDLNQHFAGQSFIYLIDLKYHRISRLFDKPGINITNIAFSANKQYFFVTINGFMAVLFRNKLQPQQIRSFTFQRTIFVTFAPHYLTIIDINGEMTFIQMSEKEEDMKETKNQLKMKKEYGYITCICSKKNLIYLGTSTGYILRFDVTTFKTAEVHQMKASIVSFKSGIAGSFLVEDSKGKMIAIASDGETTKLPINLKTAILTSPTTLLVRRRKQHVIEVYQTIGQFTPSYPKAAYRCPLMMPMNRWIQSLLREDPIDQNVLINYGMPNIANLMNARKSPNFTYEQILFLRDLIIDTPQLWKTSYRYSIFLRDFETAHSIIASNTTPSNINDKWAINMMKSALFNEDYFSKESNVESILFAATCMIRNGYVDDGVDILLTAGLWIDAVRLLFQLERYQLAAIITRVYRDDKTLNVVKDVTSKLFGIPNLISYALTMLCEVGFEKEAIDELEKIEQFYSSYVLKMVSDNENASQ